MHTPEFREVCFSCAVVPALLMRLVAHRVTSIAMKAVEDGAALGCTTIV